MEFLKVTHVSKILAMFYTAVAMKKLIFMWDDYHKEQLENPDLKDDDEDWDEEDDDGVEFIYQRQLISFYRLLLSW